MQIHVARNSAQLGIFSSEEIIAGLQSGRFLASDLAWRDGMAAWTPLGDWSEFRGVGVPPAAPASAFGAKDEASLAMPSWERGSSFAHYVATIKEVALDPVRTFANLRDGGYARPISFTYWSLLPAWLCGSILYGALFGFMALAAKGPGKLAIFVGGHRWHGHDLRETGFRAYLREAAPSLEVLDAQINLETRQLTYEATQALLSRHPPLRGIYVAGGGMEGAIAALREAKRPDVALIVSAFTPESRAALATGNHPNYPGHGWPGTVPDHGPQMWTASYP